MSIDLKKPSKKENYDMTAAVGVNLAPVLGTRHATPPNSRIQDERKTPSR